MTNYSSNDDGKIAGIISYFTIIGWLIAYFAIYNNNKTALAAYQMRQTLLFHLVSIAASWVIGLAIGAMMLTSGIFMGANIIWLVRMGFFVLWLIGLWGAINGQMKPIPLIGDRAQSIFSGI